MLGGLAAVWRTYLHGPSEECTDYRSPRKIWKLAAFFTCDNQCDCSSNDDCAVLQSIYAKRHPHAQGVKRLCLAPFRAQSFSLGRSGMCWLSTRCRLAGKATLAVHYFLRQSTHTFHELVCLLQDGLSKVHERGLEQCLWAKQISCRCVGHLHACKM